MAALDQARTLAGLARDTTASLLALRRNNVIHRPAPPAAGLVLDVGSGQAAHPRADVIVDKYVADDFERGESLDLTKPLVVADGHALPFADATFAYVIASHVLEHATDVELFASELARVATAGFVQVPSRQAELTLGWPFHPWLIDRRGDALVFNPRGDQKAPLGEFFHQAFAESTLFSLWFGAHRERWHHTLHWSNGFDVEVAGTSQAPQTATLEVEVTLDALAKMGAAGPVGPLRSALRCPADRGVLEEEPGLLRCTECGLTYPVAPGGVPVLLAEAARSA
jgi:uncharacterized protein YbaR (Trm112 family)